MRSPSSSHLRNVGVVAEIIASMVSLQSLSMASETNTDALSRATTHASRPTDDHGVCERKITCELEASGSLTIETSFMPTLSALATFSLSSHNRYSSPACKASANACSLGLLVVRRPRLGPNRQIHSVAPKRHHDKKPELWALALDFFANAFTSSPMTPRPSLQISDRSFYPF